jgi:phenylpropionate dioxygenase-like ring-hydroxylating dioxygenase large terminal subunit
MDTKLLDTRGRAYGMPEPTHDPVLPFVGPGTKGGELLRRYWQPIALSAEATELPKLIRRLGEDLILFRNKRGEAGLLYPRCSHRGTSLLYGRVEDDGIRCCYHGWKFSNQGECLDQPCEPGGGRHRGVIRQPWYPVVEAFGAIFAYLGPPEKQPLFPIFSCFQGLRDDEEIVASWFSSRGEISPFPLDHNWYQVYDNCADHYHVPILHSMISGNQFLDPRLTTRIPEIWWKYSDAGDSILTLSKRVLESGEAWMRIEQGIIPNLLALPPFFADAECATVTAFVPIDDTSCMPMDIARQPKGFQPQLASGDFGFGPEKKSWGQMTLEDHQRHPLDYEAQASQGKISFHSQEHLVSSDRGVSMHRRLFKKQCDIVAEGGDPVGVAFAEKDRVVRIEARSWMVSAGEVEFSAAPPHT